MHRRTLLRGLATVTVGGATAGCMGNNREVPRTAPNGPVDVREDDGSSGDAGNSFEDEGDSDGSDNSGSSGGTEQLFTVPEYEFQPDEDGDLVVILTVRNETQERQVAVMRVHVSAGGHTYEPTRLVSLASGEQTTYRIHVPLATAEYVDPDGFQPVFEPGTPSTPLSKTTLTRPPTETDSNTRESATETDADTGESVTATSSDTEETPTATASSTADADTNATETDSTSS